MTEALLDWLIHPIWTAVVGVAVCTAILWVCGSETIAKPLLTVVRSISRMGRKVYIQIFSGLMALGIAAVAASKFTGVGQWTLLGPLYAAVALPVLLAYASIVGIILRRQLGKLERTTKLSLAPQFIQLGAARVYREVILDDMLTEWKGANTLTRLSLLISLLSIVTLLGQAIWSAWVQRRHP